ncbi:hypothetical protein J6590_023363 [Homalodisca vitripennis]|nr:hypothetical protein J6590_023363 [Homalodisca vitripennis]
MHIALLADYLEGFKPLRTTLSMNTVATIGCFGDSITAHPSSDRTKSHRFKAGWWGSHSVAKELPYVLSFNGRDVSFKADFTSFNTKLIVGLLPLPYYYHTCTPIIDEYSLCSLQPTRLPVAYSVNVAPYGSCYVIPSQVPYNFGHHTLPFFSQAAENKVV